MSVRKWACACSIKCVGEEWEADGCLEDGGRKKGRSTSDDEPAYNYHLCCPCVHPLYFILSSDHPERKWSGVEWGVQNNNDLHVHKLKINKCVFTLLLIKRQKCSQAVLYKTPKFQSRLLLKSLLWMVLSIVEIGVHFAPERDSKHWIYTRTSLTEVHYSCITNVLKRKQHKK